jgi:hypothetical protein
MRIQRNPLGERGFGHAQRPVHHDAASGNPDRQLIAGGMAQVAELRVGDHITTHPHSVRRRGHVGRQRQHTFR